MTQPPPTLPCCNYLEQPDGTAVACLGTTTLAPGSLQWSCDACGARCGSIAHLTCETPWRQP